MPFRDAQLTVANKWDSRMSTSVQVALIAVIAVFGCDGNKSDLPRNENTTSEKLGVQQTDEFIEDEGGVVTVEGTLNGSWLRQQSGEILGKHSKATLLDPIRLTLDTQSIPLVGNDAEVEKKLLEASGKRVRLRGSRVTWYAPGRGSQGGIAGYGGAMPAHVVEFLTVQECEIIETDQSPATSSE